VWTHPANNNAPVYRLCVTAGGGFTMGQNAVINTFARGYYQSNGPGNYDYSARDSGAAHGGTGGVWNGNFNHNTYGSVRRPLDLGSGSVWDYRGGGAVSIGAGGEARIDGMITANGDGGYNRNGGASGGSILLVAGSWDPASSGSLNTDGAADGNHGSAGGGRIAVVATDSGEIPAGLSFTARGWGGNNNCHSGAGTVWLETPDSRVIRIENSHNTFYAKTPLPAKLTPADNNNIMSWDQSGDLDGADLLLVAGAVVFNRPLSLGAIDVEHPDATIDLNGKLVKAAGCRIGGKRVSNGTHTAASLGIPQVVDSSPDGSGLLIVGNAGTIVIIK